MKQQPFFKSLRFKLTWPMLFISLLPIVSIGTVAYVSLDRSVESTNGNLRDTRAMMEENVVGRNISDAARTTAVDIDQFVALHTREVMTWASAPVLIDTAREGYARSEAQGLPEMTSGEIEALMESSQSLGIDPAADDFLKEILGSSGYFGEIFLTDAHGYNVALTNPTSDFVQSDESWWQETWEEGISVGDVEYDESAGMWGCDICVRVDDPRTEEPVGILKAVMSLTRIQEIADLNASLVQDGQISILTSDGLLVAETASGHSDKRIMNSEAVLDSSTADALRNSYFSSSACGYELIDNFLVGYARSGGSDYYGMDGGSELFDWAVVVEQPKVVAFAPLVGLNVMENNLATSRRTVSLTILGVAMFVALAAVFLALMLSRNILIPISRLQKATERIRLGEEEVDIIVDSEDEIGELSADFQNMFHERKGVEKELRSSIAEIERHNRMMVAQAELNAAMRGEEDVSALAQNIITSLAAILGAQVGAIYIPGEDDILRMVGSYAYPRRESHDSEFRFGEGLIGQTALEKQPVLLTSVPEDYIKIDYGLGESLPRNILIMPFLRDEEVKAVVELGSLDRFADTDMDFLKQVEMNIAIAIDGVQSRARMKGLLQRAQDQAKELQAQQEELQAANEQLQRQTQELQESEEQLKSQQEELESTNEELRDKSESLEQQSLEISRKNNTLEVLYKDVEYQAQELAQASQYKSEFLANMSHELRTPLNSLLVLSQDMAANRKGNLVKDQVESAEIIHKSGSDLLVLINDILDLSKVEAGKMPLNVEEILFADIADDIYFTFKHIIEEKCLGFNINISSDLPETMRTDRQRLEQVIKNLVSNAVKFTEQGIITVDFSRPVSEMWMGNSELEAEKTIAISVTDTGIGIPQEKQQAIFEAFQQVDGSTSRQYGGTGLGLSISRAMASLLGGEIHLKSEEGQGSTFTLYIPEVIGDAVELEESVGCAASDIADDPGDVEIVDRDTVLAGKKILLVDDDMRNVFALSKALEDRNLEIYKAANGQKALEVLEQHADIDLVLMDIMMPVMDGYEAMRRIREQERFAGLPVLALTAKAMIGDREDCIRAGANDYIPKPVDIDRLLSIMRAWLYN